MFFYLNLQNNCYAVHLSYVCAVKVNLNIPNTTNILLVVLHKFSHILQLNYTYKKISLTAFPGLEYNMTRESIISYQIKNTI